jgi:hypothetical protein
MGTGTLQRRGLAPDFDRELSHFLQSPRQGLYVVDLAIASGGCQLAVLSGSGVRPVTTKELTRLLGTRTTTEDSVQFPLRFRAEVSGRQAVTGAFVSSSSHWQQLAGQLSEVGNQLGVEVYFPPARSEVRRLARANSLIVVDGASRPVTWERRGPSPLGGQRFATSRIGSLEPVGDLQVKSWAQAGVSIGEVYVRRFRGGIDLREVGELAHQPERDNWRRKLFDLIQTLDRIHKEEKMLPELPGAEGAADVAGGAEAEGSAGVATGADPGSGEELPPSFRISKQRGLIEKHYAEIPDQPRRLAPDSDSLDYREAFLIAADGGLDRVLVWIPSRALPDPLTFVSRTRWSRTDYAGEPGVELSLAGGPEHTERPGGEQPVDWADFSLFLLRTSHERLREALALRRGRLTTLVTEVEKRSELENRNAQLPSGLAGQLRAEKLTRDRQSLTEFLRQGRALVFELMRRNASGRLLPERISIAPNLLFELGEANGLSSSYVQTFLGVPGLLLEPDVGEEYDEPNVVYRDYAQEFADLSGMNLEAPFSEVNWNAGGPERWAVWVSRFPENDVLENDVLENDVLENDVLENDVLENDVLENDEPATGRSERNPTLVIPASLLDPTIQADGSAEEAGRRWGLVLRELQVDPLHQVVALLLDVKLDGGSAAVEDWRSGLRSVLLIEVFIGLSVSWSPALGDLVADYWSPPTERFAGGVLGGSKPLRLSSGDA